MVNFKVDYSALAKVRFIWTCTDDSSLPLVSRWSHLLPESTASKTHINNLRGCVNRHQSTKLWTPWTRVDSAQADVREWGRNSIKQG